MGIIMKDLLVGVVGVLIRRESIAIPTLPNLSIHITRYSMLYYGVSNKHSQENERLRNLIGR